MSKISRIAILAFTVAMTTSFIGAGLAMSQTAVSEAKSATTQQPAAEHHAKPAIQLASAKTHARKKRATRHGQVYLLRGLLNIFSLGMDDLAEKMRHRGIAANVYEYGNWESLCEDAARRYRAGDGPIVLVGHSLGADSVIYMSNRLGKMGIPVALVVAFDPVHPVPLTGGTTASFVNLFQSDNGWGQPVRRGRGFRGKLSNVDLRKHTEISHTTIDKSPMLHNRVIKHVLSVLHRGSSPTRSAGTKTKHTTATAKTPEVSEKPQETSKAAPAATEASTPAASASATSEPAAKPLPATPASAAEISAKPAPTTAAAPEQTSASPSASLQSIDNAAAGKPKAQ